MSDIKLSLDEILDNIRYKIVFDTKITVEGNISYVSEHYNDGNVISAAISENQPTMLKAFCKELFNYNKKNNKTITIENFYNSIWSKEN